MLLNTPGLRTGTRRNWGGFWRPWAFPPFPLACELMGSVLLTYCGTVSYLLVQGSIGCSACVFSGVWFFVTPWTVARQAPLFMAFSRQEYWSGLPFLSPGHLSDPEVEPASLVSPALAGEFFTTAPPGKPIGMYRWLKTIIMLLNLQLG